MHFYIEIIREAIRLGKLNFLLGAIAQFGEYIERTYPDARGLEAYQAALTNQPRVALTVEDRRLVDMVLSARTQAFNSSPDAEQESVHWTTLMNHLTIGGFCLLSMLEPEVANARLEKDPAYRASVKECVEQHIAERLSIAHQPAPMILLDVDETAALPASSVGNYQGGKVYNESLLTASRKAGARDICLFTNYDVKGIIQVANFHDPLASRLLLIQELIERGFYVHAVVTHRDPLYNQGIGQYYMQYLFPFEKRVAADPAYNPRADASYLAALAETDALKQARPKAAEEEQPRTKGLAYEYLTSHLPPTLVRRGFIFIDDKTFLLEEVKGAHDASKAKWLLRLIHCMPHLSEAHYAMELKKAMHYTAAEHMALRKVMQHAPLERVARQTELNAQYQKQVTVFERDETKIQRDIDFAAQWYAPSLMRLADGKCGAKVDPGIAKALYQLAIVVTEDEKLRATAIAKLQKTTETVERSDAAAVVDTDPRIQGHAWLAEARAYALRQRDGIAFYRFGLGYLSVAAGLQSVNPGEEKRIHKYRMQAVDAFKQAILQARERRHGEIICQDSMAQLTATYATITDPEMRASVVADLKQSKIFLVGEMEEVPVEGDEEKYEFVGAGM